MGELVPGDQFDQDIQAKAEDLLREGEMEKIMVPMLLTKPELDALVRILTKAEKQAAKGQGHPSIIKWAPMLLDQAHGLQAHYERTLAEWSDAEATKFQTRPNEDPWQDLPNE